MTDQVHSASLYPPCTCLTYCLERIGKSTFNGTYKTSTVHFHMVFKKGSEFRIFYYNWTYAKSCSYKKHWFANYFEE